MNALDKYRDLILSTILTFGRYDNPISSTAIYAKSDRQISLDDFQRVVTKVIVAYQDKQMDLMEGRKDYNIILSTNGGYFVPQDANEALAGILFYSERMLPMFKRRKQLKRMIQRKFQKPVQYYKKDIPTIRQQELF